MQLNGAGMARGCGGVAWLNGGGGGAWRCSRSGCFSSWSGSEMVTDDAHKVAGIWLHIVGPLKWVVVHELCET